MALTLDDIRFDYGSGTTFSQRALDGVGMTVEAGHVTLVAGATGSGKSTLLRIAAGLLKPNRGSVTLDGAPVSGPAAGPCGVGIVFQSPENQLFAETVLDDVAFGPRNQGVPAEEALELAREALCAVGLDAEAFASRSPFALSGGEARRVAIAGVLAMRPRYLLLDEPTAGLDAGGRAAIASVIDSLRAHAGIAIVSHDFEEFLPRADMVLLLEAGRRAFMGPTRELVAAPARLVAAGLRPPTVLVIQMLAEERGALLDSPTLDPEAAAAALLAAAGWSR